MSRFEFTIMLLITFIFFSLFTLSCSKHIYLVCGNYYSQGEYIVEKSNTDGWRQGHYLLSIDSLNAFELKEVSYGLGTFYTICSGYLQPLGRNSYKLKSIKKNYPYGAIGNPYYNNNNYRITIKSKDTIILQRGQWKTPLLFIERDSIPAEFDFKKYGL